LFRDSTVDDNLLKYSSNDLGYSVINCILKFEDNTNIFVKISNLEDIVIQISTRSSATAEKQRVSCPRGGG